MVKKQTETNYHNSLKDLYPFFDQMVQLFRHQKRQGKLDENWMWELTKLPIKDIKTFSEIGKAIWTVVQLLFWLAVGATAAPFVASLWTSDKYLLIGLGALGLLITYTILLGIMYLPKMLNIKDSTHFHLAAYRDRRPAEFQMFNRALEDNDFSFHGLFEYVNGVLTYQEQKDQAIQSLLEDFDKQREEYKYRIENLDIKHETAIREYQSILNDISSDINQLEKMTHYLLDFLSEINVILFRMNNDQFQISDLRFLTGFTIYEVKNDALVKLPNADHGTTGASIGTIPIEDERYENYSSVRAAKEKDNTPVFQEVREDYVIVSYKMRMGIEGKRSWIFNFHINTSINEKAWNLLLNDDILNTSEIYRLFHALCLLILKRGYGTEVLDDVSS